MRPAASRICSRPETPRRSVGAARGRPARRGAAAATAGFTAVTLPILAHDRPAEAPAKQGFFGNPNVTARISAVTDRALQFVERQILLASRSTSATGRIHRQGLGTKVMAALPVEGSSLMLHAPAP